MDKITLTPNSRRANRGIITAKLAGIIAALCILALFIGWKLCHHASSADIARATAQALCDHDVTALLSLTAPEEVEKLHLTADGVAGVLNETLYTHTLPKSLNVTLFDGSPVDQHLYHGSPVGPPQPGIHYPLDIVVNEFPDHRWYLPLGYILFASCGACSEDRSPGAARRAFTPLADKYGILGFRLNSSGYRWMHPR